MSRWTEAFLKKAGRKNKYKAQRTASGFPSKLEESVYADLLYQEKAGMLRDIERYPSVKLTRRVTWKCDFKAFDVKLGEPVWIEAKGVETERYRLIKQLWHDLGPGLLRVYKGANGRVWIHEEIRGDSG